MSERVIFDGIITELGFQGMKLRATNVAKGEKDIDANWEIMFVNPLQHEFRGQMLGQNVKVTVQILDTEGKDASTEVVVERLKVYLDEMENYKDPPNAVSIGPLFEIGARAVAVAVMERLHKILEEE